ncbi:MAG: TIGR00268 family protein [Desulfobulbus sp.]|nr:MAG: TIGR00268 family protein [Desulfobulbus sp.]
MYAGENHLELLEQKTTKLHGLLHEYARVAVAFSGGVDSSFLLKSALDVLGAGNVLVMHAKSCLVGLQEQRQAENWPARHGFLGVEFSTIELQPLLWKEFVENSERRCYFCKLRMYKEFMAVMHGYDLHVLLDGTNTDDLKDRRPGLSAIHELGVQTPLVDAGFSKNDIRACSRSLGLDTWDIPSASCLATRIPHGVAITGDRLEKIAMYEEGMATLGFTGCRVGLHPQQDDTVFLRILHSDFDRFARPGMRQAIVRFFQRSGITDIFLNLQGREMI